MIVGVWEHEGDRCEWGWLSWYEIVGSMMSVVERAVAWCWWLREREGSDRGCVVVVRMFMLSSLMWKWRACLYVQWFWARSEKLPSQTIILILPNHYKTFTRPLWYDCRCVRAGWGGDRRGWGWLWRYEIVGSIMSVVERAVWIGPWCR